MFIVLLLLMVKMKYNIRNKVKFMCIGMVFINCGIFIIRSMVYLFKSMSLSYIY